jgi:hypothetical protein
MEQENNRTRDQLSREGRRKEAAGPMREKPGGCYSAIECGGEIAGCATVKRFH